MLKIIIEYKRLREENAQLRKVIKGVIECLDDAECPIGVRLLCAQCVLEEIIKVTEGGHAGEGVKKESR